MFPSNIGKKDTTIFTIKNAAPEDVLYHFELQSFLLLFTLLFHFAYTGED